MACGIGLQKLCVHNWGVVNSFRAIAAELSGFSEGGEEKREEAP